MLKRQQILLNDWQVEHYDLISGKYDVSFSEMIRMALCIDILQATRATFPDYKIDIDKNVLKSLMTTRKLAGKTQMETFHRHLSKIYFETRKAAELWKETLENDK